MINTWAVISTAFQDNSTLAEFTQAADAYAYLKQQNQINWEMAGGSLGAQRLLEKLESGKISIHHNTERIIEATRAALVHQRRVHAIGFDRWYIWMQQLKKRNEGRRDMAISRYHGSLAELEVYASSIFENLQEAVG